MSYHQKLILLIYAYLLHFLGQLSLCSHHPGHLKPFGSSGPFKPIDQLTDEFPNPIDFFKTYVSKSQPVLFRQVLINDPHLSLWNTDEELHELFHNSNDTIHVETSKKESRKQNILSMTMTEFLQRYQQEELYLVEEVPNLLRPFFTVPTCLQCEPASETFQVAMLWFSSGNTSSVVHTDDYDNINCVLQGDKQFILVDPHQHQEVASEIIDNYSGSFSSIDVDHVDYHSYPSLDNHSVFYHQVNLSRGDCLFIPALWIHQVRSDQRNIAVNYWLDHERVKSAVVNKDTCLLTERSHFLTLATILWPTDSSAINHLKNFMLDLVDGDESNFMQWTTAFSKDLYFDLQTNIQAITLFAEFFDTVDTNGNGFVTIKEIDSLFQSDNMTIAYEILQDILDVIEEKGIVSEPLTDLRDDEMFDDDYDMNATLSDDNTTYTFEHEDL